MKEMREGDICGIKGMGFVWKIHGEMPSQH